MKVMIVGGYGVFGSRLAALLARDGHTLWIAGRDAAKARAVAAPLGAEAIRADLRGDLDAVFAPNPEVVIDAAGPFQSYGAAPYALAQACIARGVNYLDLSDAGSFTAGVGALDAAARSAGVWVLSGASSAPGLSSSAAAALAEGLESVATIDVAILPGNRAPRGASVIASILSGVGRPSPVWRDGRWTQICGWSDKRRYRLAPGLTRSGYFVDIPDIHLFPAFFGARTVTFHAGLELGVMNAALSALGFVRRWVSAPLPPFALRAIRALADALRPFGTDRGGMQVRVTGAADGRHVERVWTLIAEAGEGPYIPGVMARAALRNAAQIPPGARPCLNETPLNALTEAMSDLAISARIDETATPPFGAP